ncbi:low temperature requirement protein A [Streptomyces sp. NPDC002668]|uniref:low temperature requirement protein A n=1 Tax=Streptomyces sp. NPDC002668 TaxID=3154422 RepID=UPI003323FDDE
MALWTASILLHPPLTYILWAAGLATEVATTLYHRAHPVLEISHLVERFGLFVIIVLGEGVAQLVTALATVHSTPHAMVTAIPAFAVLAALWWVYFDYGSAVAASAPEWCATRFPGLRDDQRPALDPGRLAGS